MSKLIVKQWRLDRLREYGRNPRKNDDVVDRMCEAIQEFGFRIPIVAKSDGLIVDGHLRYKAALKLGLPTVPVALADELTDAQIRAFRLLANQSASWASWDEELLRFELTDLKLENYDLRLTGFDDIELVNFLAMPNDRDPEAVPEPPADLVSRTGDIWLLGEHRLLCGDATSAADVDAMLDGAKPHLMVTDPPYGVDYDPDWRNRADRANGKPYGARAVGLVSNDDRADWSEAWKLFPGDVAYVWSPPGSKQLDHYDALIAAEFEIRMQLIWAKQQFPIGRGNYHVQHEPCWYTVRKGKTAHWQGDRTQSTLWQIDKPVKSETGHSTQKPIECMKRPIENNSAPGDYIYDPFVGSGTTIIAAEMTARRCLAIEINSNYVDVCVIRWQDYTNKKSVLEATGQTFEEIAEERSKKKSRPKAARSSRKRGEAISAASA